MKAVLERIIEADSRILKTPAPFIGLSSLSASSVDIKVRVWTKTEAYWDVYFDMNKIVYDTFNKEGIGFPFPQLTVHQGKRNKITHPKNRSVPFHLPKPQALQTERDAALFIKYSYILPELQKGIRNILIKSNSLTFNNALGGGVIKKENSYLSHRSHRGCTVNQKHKTQQLNNLMRLKTFIITGLTGLLCSCTHAQQAQYWKETPYDLENVDFDTDVAKFFSKAQAITDTTTFLTDNPLKYILEKHTLGDTVIYDYEVNGVKYSEKVAKYGKIIFPYIAMIADEQRKMAGLISKTYINNPQTLDLLISSLAKQYGWEATVIRQYKKTILVWEKDGKKVVLRAMEPGNEDPTTAIFITKDQKRQNHKHRNQATAHPQVVSGNAVHRPYRLCPCHRGMYGLW